MPSKYICKFACKSTTLANTLKTLLCTLCTNLLHWWRAMQSKCLSWTICRSLWFGIMSSLFVYIRLTYHTLSTRYYASVWVRIRFYLLYGHTMRYKTIDFVVYKGLYDCIIHICIVMLFVTNIIGLACYCYDWVDADTIFENLNNCTVSY